MFLKQFILMEIVTLPCGTTFDAKKFLEQHPQFDWMNGLLKDRPTQPWTVFKAGEKE